MQIRPLHDVQAYMGHADIQTSMFYAHHTPNRNAASDFSAHVASQEGAPDAVPIAA